jgi:hypothetical protein
MPWQETLIYGCPDKKRSSSRTFTKVPNLRWAPISPLGPNFCWPNKPPPIRMGATPPLPARVLLHHPSRGRCKDTLVIAPPRADSLSTVATHPLPSLRHAIALPPLPCNLRWRSLPRGSNVDMTAPSPRLQRICCRVGSLPSLALRKMATRLVPSPRRRSARRHHFRRSFFPKIAQLSQQRMTSGSQLSLLLKKDSKD